MSSVQPLDWQSPASTAVPMVGPLRTADRPTSSAAYRPPEAESQAEAADGGGIDQNLVQETKLQIRGLVQEITRLCQSDASLAEFYDGFLTRVTGALASVGGAFWTVDDNDKLELQYQINLTSTGLVDAPQSQLRHNLLLKKVFSSGESILAPPQSGAAEEDEAGNPTDLLLVLGTIRIDRRVVGIVEVFQRPGGGPTTQRGYLRFLVQMCELAGDFLKNRRLRHFNDRQILWERLEQFIRVVHRSLDTQDTVYSIANEARRLIDVDRVSVALCHGRRCVIEAVSGLDTIDRRSQEVKRLARLAKAVTSARQPLWYHGDADDLPPQIESALHNYVDRAHSKLVAVLPLLRAAADDQSPPSGNREPLGALIVEQLHDSRAADGLTQRVEVVAAHSADALGNALDHSRLFLLPLWKLLGQAKWVVAARNLPKTAAVLGLVAAVAAALCLVPTDFDAAATGTLHPKIRRDIFAPVDGVLVEVPLPELADQIVERGVVLARLENKELEVEIIGLLGSKDETNKRILSIQRTLLNNPRLTPVEESQLSGELSQLIEARDSIQRQLAVYREKQDQLTITSPQRGQIVTWQARENLLQRPVQRGQVLLTLVDPSGPWELELLLPERRMCHVLAAQRWSREPLRVTFVLATHPGAEFQGRVVEIDPVAEVRGDEGNTVRVRVAVEKEELPDLRDGAKVTARVYCGRRPLGYVWFHDVIETVQTKILFWL